MKIAKAANGFRSDQRRIAREHQKALVLCQLAARTLDSMTGAALFRLNDEFHPSVRKGRADLLRSMTDNHVNVFCRYHFCRSSDHVREQGLAPNLMQHLGAL